MSVPAYLRPSNTRKNTDSSHRSSQSTSRPQPQHREYIGGIPTNISGEPSEDIITNIWTLDPADSQEPSPTLPDGINDEGDDNDDGPPSRSESGNMDDWDNLRDGSIARRSPWKRPSPGWAYTLVGATVCMGMCAAPRSEIYINLACLAHPPQHRSTASMVSTMDHRAVRDTMDLQDYSTWKSVIQDDSSISLNKSMPAPTKPERHLSPADEWFLKLQHDIYEYEIHHKTSPEHEKPSTPSSTQHTSILGTSTYLPQPTGPSQRPPFEIPSEEPDTPPTTPNRPYEEIDPDLCKRDAKVQGAAAKITMVMTLTMGLLSAITTGFWGQTSDRIGRTKVLAVVYAGFLINEILFVLVATFPYLAPGGYRALLIGPTIDGLLGGYSTMSATVYAYISDVTSDGSRATVFSRLAGILMLGFAVGPILGSALILATGNIMAPFYLTLLVHTVFITLILTLLPESLSTQSRMILTKNAEIARARKRQQEVLEREWENETPHVEASDPLLAPTPAESGWSLRSNGVTSKRQKRLYGSSRRFIKKAFHFLEPLGVFLPRERDDEAWDGRRGKDWNLTWVGVTLLLMSMMMGIIQTKAQFALYVYGWTSTQLGPYMSLMGFGRGFVLLAVIPVVMYYIKPYFTPTTVVEPVSDPSASAFSAISAQSTSGDEVPEPVPTTVTQRSTHLDLLILRTCLLFETAPYIILAFNPSATIFVVMTAVITLGSAGGPAINSLALGLLPSSREKGRLFGGIAVLHSIGASLLSPLLFGTLFAETVGWYAPTVFAVAASILVMAQLALAFVRLPKDKDDVKVERGRSRGVKRVKSSAIVFRQE